MFKSVPARLNSILLEEQTLNFWRLHRIFEKSLEQRKGAPVYVFFERPPIANSKPELQHALTRAYKDLFLRYQTMRGKYVVRRGGWDTHGLPVEIRVEKQLGLTSKSQIDAFGVELFNHLCQQSAFEFIHEWEKFTSRLGYWVDLDDAYVTYTNEYIESVWWILKAFWDRELLYQGYKVTPYCPRCGTPLSDYEASLGNREITDPSIYVRIPLASEPNQHETGVSLLVWTIAPWTLPGNVAVAVHPDVDYVTIERPLEDGERERLVIAETRLEQVFGEEWASGRIKIIERFKGKKLKEKAYQPLFTFSQPDKPAFSVILLDSVTAKEGTGLVNVAPAFGIEDMQAAIDNDLPILMTITESGAFSTEVRPWSGKFVKDADPFIIQDLQARGLLFKAEHYPHSYPYCIYCDTPLINCARRTWYLRASPHRQRMIELNHDIQWFPETGKEKFANGLEKDLDWALGRERYWGAPLPVWECENCRHQLAVGSIAELARLTGRDLSKLDLHRPAIDEVHFPCPECNRQKVDTEPTAEMRRVPELIDVWFDAGAMPVAQWHFPFENREIFRQQYPADFICETIDQIHSWFYTLHAISSILNDSAAYKNVICLGALLDDEGQKLSKSQSASTDPWRVFNTHGADALRWRLYTAAPPGQEHLFSDDLAQEVKKNFIHLLWEVYAFFVAYAKLEGWQPATKAPTVPVKEPYRLLDEWLRSELHALIRQVTQALDEYNALAATHQIQDFVEDLAKWYLPRSRKRFLKHASQEDKRSAFSMLYETLIILSKLLAPGMPFLAEALYQNLARSVDRSALESVHLHDWPAYDPGYINPHLSDEMRLVRKLAALGHAARRQAGVKTTQSLLEIIFATSAPEEIAALERFADLLADELNVKRVNQVQAPDYGSDKDEIPTEALPSQEEIAESATTAMLKTELNPELVSEGLAREFARRVQDLRKQAELEIAEPITLYLTATPDLAQAIQEHLDFIVSETLASEIIKETPPPEAIITDAWFDGQWMKTGLLRKLAASEPIILAKKGKRKI
jgi:isoleucyl-tRNA synthetase